MSDAPDDQTAYDDQATPDDTSPMATDEALGESGLESDPLAGAPSGDGGTTGASAAAGGEADTGETLGGAHPEPSNPASKDPSDWVTGDEPITGAQKSYLDTLARDAGEEISADLTKAEASEHIDRLQKKTGRGE